MSSKKDDNGSAIALSSFSGKGKANFFANIKISAKTYAGFGIVLALLVLVGFIGFKGLTDLGDSFNDYANVATDTRLAGVVDRNVVGLRRNVLAFVMLGDEKAGARATELVDEVNKQVAELLERVQDKDRREFITSIDNDISEYGANFTKVLDLAHSSWKARDEELFPTGIAARKAFTEIIKTLIDLGDFAAAAAVGVTQEALMLARINTTEFDATSNQEGQDKVRANLEELRKSIDVTRGRLPAGEIAQQFEAAAALVAKYGEIFDRYAPAAQESESLVSGRLTELAGQIADVAAKLTADQIVELTELDNASEAEIETTKTFTMVVALVAVLLGALIAFVIVRGIAGPILKMTTAMGKLAGGDKTVPIEGAERKDEIGAMAKAVQVFKDNAIEMDRLQAEQKETEKRTEQEKRQAMLDLADSLESSVKSIVESVSSAATEMETTAQSMSATAEETNRQSTTVAAAAEEASTNVQTVASAAEELSSSIEEVGRQVTQSSKVAGNAVKEAEATNASVKGLAVAAEKIGAVVSLIQDIAEQTNLLALNATIEAARAGEAGKGFAVVASEVKSLANQTAKATEEIGGQIAAIQGSTAEAVTAIDGIGKIIAELDEIATSIAAAVEEQGAATQEIARNVQQAAAGTGDVSSNIGGIAQAAGESGAAATQVLTAAQDLSKQSASLRNEIDKFLQRVRAA